MRSDALIVRMHSNSDSRRSGSPARDVSRIGPATDCEISRNVGLLWGEKPLVNDSLDLNFTGWGERRIKLIIRRSQVQVLPAPPIYLAFFEASSRSWGESGANESDGVLTLGIAAVA